MHGLSFGGRRFARAMAVGAIAAMTIWATSSTSIAASPLPAAIAGKLVTGSDLGRIATDSNARQPVIIEFAMPALPDSASFATPDLADAAQTSAVHAVQDQILGRFLGGSSELARAESSPDLIVKRMDFSPMFGINVTRAELEKLAADPAVVRIHQDKIDHPTLLESLPLIQMPAAYAAGATGNGFHVAVLDTGARRSHEFLSSRIVRAACFSTTNSTYGSTSYCPGGASSSTDINSANDCDESQFAGCGHGTHTNGTAAGFNTNLQAGEPQNGVARDARLININVFSKFPPNQCGSNSGPSGCVLTFNTDQIKGLEHVFALRNTLQIAAASMSLGGGFNSVACDSDSRKIIIDQLRAANIATVIAAGNDGRDTEVGAPGCISTAITVASSTKQDQLSSFSNWGTLIDVVAPGSNILASYVSGSSNNTYASLSGTSMATPHVAGAWAALRSARPNATVTQIENALESTGLTISCCGAAKPRIRVNNALTALPGGPVPAPNLVAAVAPVARATQVGNTVTAFATIINAGNATGTSCFIGKPAGTYNFTYRTNNGNNSFGPVNTPVNIAGGNTVQNFLMTFQPTAAMSANLALVFDCTNSNPAPSVVGLNSFLLTGTTTPVADMIATGATPTGDGILNVPLGGAKAAAFAAVNFGASASLQARVSASGIGAAAATLPGSMFICQTNPNTGLCLPSSPPAATANFTLGNGATATFTAFFNSNGTAIPFDPANKRLFVNFFQGTTGVGSASVAIRTVAPDAATVTSASAN